MTAANPSWGFVSSPKTFEKHSIGSDVGRVVGADESDLRRLAGVEAHVPGA
jgi:hypothetical protein